METPTPDQNQTVLNIGDQAPDFTLPQNGGADVTLSALRGKPVVFFFYPKDNTPACTTEAQDFSRLSGDFAKLGVKLFGISKDSIKKHENFCKKQALTVPLLSDLDSDVCERFGVWAEKQMYGKTYLGIVRTTVLIDAAGKIAQIWPKVSVKGHAEEVLAAAKEL